ncbi:hypothetical protein SAMN04488483_0124 [Pseudomonas helmanticensis]|uniref:Uncharacterized protein n=1 Tax=Pseudomonas helmanticensis TaxID=1471381 RepID=A0ACD2TZ84_9PSED|nr:hypothetical protein [Pseudomonas helmanticensis]SMQ22154.1 hypothetical protein SAMN04488483_0124 [Pseudomonas helmanticensis]
MAKNNEQAIDEPLPSPIRQSVTSQLQTPDLLLKFRDTVFTSRTLCIPGTNRTLSVVKATVEVSASDEQAFTYLKSHPEIEPLE